MRADYTLDPRTGKRVPIGSPPGLTTAGYQPPSNVLTASAAPSPTGSLSIPKSPYMGVANSTLGTSNPFLPDNFNFSDLAKYAQTTGDQYAQNLTNTLTKRRSDLATSLNNQGKSLFDLALPDINEGLNASGVYTSPTARAQAEAQALKQIDLSNQSYLNDFDNSSISAELGANKDTMDTVLGLRGNQLESQLQQGQSSQEMALAEKLAKQQSRTSLLNSLIGAGGNIGGSLLTAKLLGFGVGAVDETASTVGTAGAGTAGSAAGGLGAAGVGGGIGSALLPVAGAGAGLALYEEGRKMLNKQGFNGDVSKALSVVPGIGLSVGAANKALGGALASRGNGTGSGGGTATEQRQLDSELAQLQSMRAAVQSGQLDPSTYQQQAQAMIDDISQRVGSLTGKSSAWANAINPNWKRFQDQGFARAENGRWIAG